MKAKKAKRTLKTGFKLQGWDTLLGCISYTGKRKSIREMDQAVAAEARSRALRELRARS